MLLATQVEDRGNLDRGLKMGKEVIEKYGIEKDSQWLQQPHVSRLTPEQQKEVRYEVGEMLLFMARGEQKLVKNPRTPDELDKERVRIALQLNALALDCYPPGQFPQLLACQREELKLALPEEAHRFQKLESNESAKTAPYHEGVAHALEGRYREALVVLKPYTEVHPQHYESWFVRGMCHEQLGEYGEAAECWTCCIAPRPRPPPGPLQSRPCSAQAVRFHTVHKRLHSRH